MDYKRRVVKNNVVVSTGNRRKRELWSRDTQYCTLLSTGNSESSVMNQRRVLVQSCVYLYSVKERKSEQLDHIHGQGLVLWSGNVRNIIVFEH